jgi:hypothetical protein
MSTNPYRDLSKQDPLIKSEMEELEDQLEKEDEERVQRILKSLVKAYKSNKIDGSKFFLEDPGKYWWNTSKMIPKSVLNTKFGNLLISRMKELGFSCYESDKVQDIGAWGEIDYEKVLVWHKD